MTLSAGERETVITWSDADRTARVFTAQRPTARRLRRIRGATLLGTSTSPRGEWWGEEWEVPIKAVIPRNPPRGGPGGIPPRGRPFQAGEPASARRTFDGPGHSSGGQGDGPR